MPMLDMPLEKLREYTGTNPRPDDFDEYWEKALAELAATPADPEFIPADFQVPGVICEDLYYTGVRNARIHAKHLRPAKFEGKLPCMLLFHGYSGNCGNWTDLLKWVSAGFTVFAMDVRGQGGLSEDSSIFKGNTLDGHIIRGLENEDPQDLFFRHVFLDTKQMANIAFLQDFVDPSRVYAHGGSQGGALTIACSALEPRVSRSQPHVAFLTDYKRTWEMDLDKDAYKDLKYYFRYFDPRHIHEDEIFKKLGYIDLQFLAPRIQAEVLMSTCLLDNICPPSTQFAAYNRMTCVKHHLIYPDYGHETPQGYPDLSMQFLLNGTIPEGCE